MTRKTTRLAWRQMMLLAAPVLLLMIMLVLLAFWVHAHHRNGEEQLSALEPRYARLLGMQMQEQEIQQALERIAEVKALHVYPGEGGDAMQTGNGVQQRLRTALDRAGLSVVSSQVRLNPEEGTYERIDIIMTSEGEWSAVQLALLSLRDLSPTVWLQDLEVGLLGNLQTSDVKTAPRVSVQLTFSILRSKTS